MFVMPAVEASGLPALSTVSVPPMRRISANTLEPASKVTAPPAMTRPSLLEPAVIVVPAMPRLITCWPPSTVMAWRSVVVFTSMVAEPPEKTHR